MLANIGNIITKIKNKKTKQDSNQIWKDNVYCTPLQVVVCDASHPESSTTQLW